VSYPRPDGYIGYRCAGFELADLQCHMARWFPRMSSSAAPHETYADDARGDVN